MSCPICLNLQPSHLNDLQPGQRATYFIRLTDLLNSPHECTECKVLVDAIAALKPDYSSVDSDHSVELTVAPNLPLQLYSRPLSLYLELFRDPDFQTVSCIPSTIGWPEFTVTKSSGSEASKLLIHEWLSECHSSHDSCRNQDEKTQLPTRCLEIAGSDDFTVRLEQTAGCLSKYVALSYCWGDPQFHRCITTTKKTVLQHQEGIVFQNLPQSLQDAVRIARWLGYDYIWIDALCIVQDDAEDWAREAALMNQVYTNAALTIIASRSSGCREGIFGQHVFSAVHDVPYKRCLLKARNELAREHVDVTGLEREPISNEAINKRAWTLQEALLSNHALLFTSQELRWQCNEWRKCECGTFSSRTDALEVQNLNALRTGHLPRDSSAEDAYRTWAEIIDIFTQRSITYDKDRLPALSGLAQQFARVMKSNFDRDENYLAGMWRHSLPAALMWNVESDYHVDTRDSNLHRRRPKAWRAPSWSWASVEACVEMPPYLGTEWIAEVIDASTTPSGVDRCGEISSGWLKIRGPIVEELTLLHDEARTGVNGVLTQNGSPLCGFVPDDQYLGLKQSEHNCHDLCALVLGHARTLRQYSLLVLAESSNGAYRRVGVAVQGTFWTNSSARDMQYAHAPSYPYISTSPELIGTAEWREIVIV